MLGWIVLLLLILVLILFYLQSPTQQKSKPNFLNIAFPFHVQAEEPLSRDWLVQAERDYGTPLTFPQAADTLATMGFPQSQIEQNKPIIQSNLSQIQEDNKQSLEEKKKDPRSNPPRYGVTVASIYEPSEFLAKNTGLKSYPPPPPQSVGQPAPPPPPGMKVITPDKSKILPVLDLTTVDGTPMPVYNQNQCGCCWAIAGAALLNYHIRKKTGKLDQIAFANKYTFCIDPKNGFSGVSNACQGGIPTDVFVYMNQVKKLDTFQNTPTNYSFNDKIKDCATMNQGGGNPTLAVTTSDFPTAGLVTLYRDGKFYFNPTIDQTFQPTSTLILPNQEQVDTIKYILCVNGPLVIGMNANGSNITNYVGGVSEFRGGQPDHAVLLIGYKDNYWIIQNSWSDRWGIKGIIQADISKSYLTMMTSIVLPDSGLLI